MNILFVTENEISQQMGGTDRITITLSDEFSRLGHSCFLAFCRRTQNPDKCSFRETVLLEDSQESELLTDLLQTESIDIVVSNLVGINYKRRLLPLIYRATRGTKTKVVACYHAMPGEDLLGNRIGNSLYRIRTKGEIVSNLKDIALSIIPAKLIKTLFGRRITDKYRLMYDYSDLLVLHTPQACRAYAEIAGLPCDSKFAAVPSALSYDTFLEESGLGSKRREVLIVARMDEKPKRISFALKVWKRINESGRYDDWHLRLVGGGGDLDYYIRLADRMELQNITFEGRVADVARYYREASIFMLTSSYEGWALTLTEAQQFGVVPVALDSYVSLPAIIENHKTGIIVPDNDLQQYASEVMWLMGNEVAREKIARNGLVSCRRFAAGKVAGEWINHFTKLLEAKNEQ